MSDDQVVIDACVALKWRLRDEEGTAQADALLDDCIASRVELLAPTLFDYEIANALRTALIRGRITEADAERALGDFQQLTIRRVSFPALQTLAFRLACEWKQSVYDAAYLALARTRQLPFLTGDRRLWNAVHVGLPWVRWIGDYQSAPVREE